MKIQLELGEIDILEALDDQNVKTGVVHECRDECGLNFYEVDIHSDGFDRFKTVAIRASALWSGDTQRMALLDKLAKKLKESGIELELHTTNEFKLPELTNEGEQRKSQFRFPFGLTASDFFKREGAQIVVGAYEKLEARLSESERYLPLRGHREYVDITFEFENSGEISQITKILIQDEEKYDDLFCHQIRQEFSKFEFPPLNENNRKEWKLRFWQK